MRVLFVSGAEMPDYQCDMLLHGLREILGENLVDVNRVWYMYAKEFADGRHNKSDLYGRGFTMYGLLGDDAHVDRTDIEAKISTRYFDFVVYGSIRRCQDHIDSVLAHYPACRIAFVDGEDDQSVVGHLLGRGLYFKRELDFESGFVKPIQFAIPSVKIGTVLPYKKKIEAYIDPRDRSTYVYDTESRYYGDYAESLFGFTQKKAGWDCLRHYEIIANACVPNFENLEDCPTMTMVFLPKYELLRARNLLQKNGRIYFETTIGRSVWEDIQRTVHNVLQNHLTTAALARYVLDVMHRPDRVPMLSSAAAG